MAARPDVAARIKFNEGENMMSKRCLTGALALVLALGLTACGGGSGNNEGRMDDTMETYFFDFTVNGA